MGTCSNIKKNHKKINTKSEIDMQNKENELDEKKIFDQRYSNPPFEVKINKFQTKYNQSN